MPCFREEDIHTLLAVGAVEVVCLVAPVSALVRRVCSASGRVPVLVLVAPEQLAASVGEMMEAGACAVLPHTLEVATWHQVVERQSEQRLRGSAAERNSDEQRKNGASGNMSAALATLREFSRLLAYSLNQESLVQHFIERLRELLGVSRVAIYLQAEEEHQFSLTGVVGVSQRFFCAGSLGIPSGVAQSIALTRVGGLGRLLSRDCCVVRANQVFDDERARQELETLGCTYALPVCDLEGVIGIVALGGVIAKNTLGDPELQLTYHLLEQLGQAVQNSRLHERLETHHGLIKRILDAVAAGVVVFDRGFEVVYSNAACERLLRLGGRKLAFALLPKEVATSVHQAVEYREFSEPFVVPPTEANAPWLRFSLIPLTLEAEPKAAVATMVVIEDHSVVRTAEKSAAASATASTISLLAERFAHEVRNSLTAIMAHGQMLDEAFDRPDFRQSMKVAIDGEGRRIGRLTQQLLLMATPEDKLGRSGERVPLADVLQAAFDAARTQCESQGRLVLEAGEGDWSVPGPRGRLVHAFSELFLNSLQTGENASVVVGLRKEGAEIRIAMRDSGPGFTSEVAARAMEPFYTTRTVGIGLGLTVAANIFGASGGAIRVQSRTDAAAPDLIVTLPACS